MDSKMPCDLLRSLSRKNAVITVLLSSLVGIWLLFFAEEFFDRESASVSTIAYMLAPYRFIGVYVRGALNEALS